MANCNNEHKSREVGKLINIAKIPDWRGNLSFIENGTHLPFVIERVYWIYDIPSAGYRSGRALRTCDELIVSMSGSLDVTLDDGRGGITRHTLNRPWQGLLVPRMTWRAIDNVSSSAVAMVLASAPYSEADYIRNYDVFKSETQTPPATIVASSRHSPCATASVADGHLTADVRGVKEITLERHRDECGSLSVVENGGDGVPFDIKRAFYLYDVPADAERGGHSHYQARELMIALSGSFDVVLDDGRQQRRFTLNRPYRALYVPSGLWRTMDNFSSGAVLLVLTSETYSEADYVRNYEHFKTLTADAGNKRQQHNISDEQH